MQAEGDDVTRKWDDLKKAKLPRSVLESVDLEVSADVRRLAGERCSGCGLPGGDHWSADCWSLAAAAVSGQEVSALTALRACVAALGKLTDGHTLIARCDGSGQWWANELKGEGVDAMNRALEVLNEADETVRRALSPPPKAKP